MKYHSHNENQTFVVCFSQYHFIFTVFEDFAAAPILLQLTKTIIGYILPRVGNSSLGDSETCCFWSSSSFHRVSFPFPGTKKEPTLLSLCRVMNAQFISASLLQHSNGTRGLVLCPPHLFYSHRDSAIRSVWLTGKRKDLYKRKFLMVILWSKM